MVISVAMTTSNMTYRQLLERIKSFDDEQLDQNVTVFVWELDEYYPLDGDCPICNESTDVLDPGHYYLVI